MKEFIKKLLASGSSISSKRFITIVALIMVVITWAVDLFTDRTISEYIWTGLLAILGTGLGTVTLTDIFAKKGIDPTTNEEENQGGTNEQQ